MSEKEDKSAEKEEPKDLETLFDMFARFGDRESDGTITLKNIDKWLKQAELLDKKGGVTNADTAITFSKIVKNKKRMDLNEFQEFIETLANDKKVEPKEFTDKLIAAGEPKLSSVTTPITGGAVGRNLRRMTDTKLYTGAHKERFDEEGKGKGKEGRTDIQSDTGYVSGFKKDEKHGKHEDKDKDENEDDKKHKKK
ncbi:tubulin polymerization-promoting protein homolog [Argiope bruennichi]|uniref:Tubulin polymerization-promoting protein like n=1 Tax=Argiope bruennichi TaxID=94029 RepID=A0A8T0G195_ARGBR|nr:tubulin polymerization-promoting protein homolog [Argiope bruennichi]KAF8796275.1 Tubulin polymerization-promoting protein like [Argiope bruennichi]